MKTILLIIALFVPSAFAGGISSFYYTPGPSGSYVIKDKTQTEESDSDHRFSLRTINPSSKVINNYVVLTIKSTKGSWVISLKTPREKQLHKGIYVGSRFGVGQNDTPTFSLTGYGRGCNTSTTFFNIREIEYNEKGSLDRIAIDFIQVEEVFGKIDLTKMKGYSWAFGSYRFNSTIPVSKDIASATTVDPPKKVAPKAVPKKVMPKVKPSTWILM